MVRTPIGIVDVSPRGNLLNSGHPAIFGGLIPAETLAATPVATLTALQEELEGNLVLVTPSGLQTGKELIPFSVPRAVVAEPNYRRGGQKLAALMSRHLGIEFFVQRS